MKRFGRHSLFWTFSGAFLLVLLLAGVLQVAALAISVGPVAGRWLRDRASVLVQTVSGELAALDQPVDPARVEQVLRAHSRPPIHLFLELDDGRVLGRGRRMRARMAGEAPTESPGAHAPGPPGSGPLREDRDHVELARVPVRLASLSGELVALSPRPRVALWPTGAPPRLALFVPIALLVAGGGGLVLFRALVKRLRALESLAYRVAEGDLDARVPSPGRDEIGRLGAQLNRMTERLAEARDRIADDDRTRRQLVADISHDLATPLTSIRGFAETLDNEEVALTPEERSRYLGNILEESKRLDLLVRDLLELTRLEAGAIALERERLDWAALCRNTVERHLPRFARAGLVLEWEEGAGARGVWVDADGRRLEQLIENLLVNELRYVPGGGTVRVAARAGGEVHALVVSDDGPGFPPDALPHVFDRFYRADAARSSEGSGLGLAIVREIAERHGGSVRAENAEGGGARVIVELPAGVVDAGTDSPGG